MRDNEPIGWVFYDAECSFCRASLRPLMPALRDIGFGVAGLQERWVRERLGLSGAELLEEMRVLTPEGQMIGGADACVYLTRRAPWAWPLYGLAQVPGAMPLLRSVYRFVARRRRCLTTSCHIHLSAGLKRGGP